MSRTKFSTSNIRFVILLAVTIIAISIVPSTTEAGIDKRLNRPAGWVGLYMGYISGPDLGGYRNFVNEYYSERGSLQQISDFGGQLAFNFEYKSFFSSHFAYGFSICFGGFATDQVFDYVDNNLQAQAFEEYRYKAGQFGFDLSFTPVNTRKTKIVPYISAGGLLYSGVLDLLISENDSEGQRAYSFRDNTFDIGYRFGGGLIYPVGESIAISANSYYSHSNLKFDVTFDNGKHIKIKNDLLFIGFGIAYFYK
ncbi:MAG: hypothetical protein GY855_13630 [candidate division Zixibacteria bacterium]|nr:hypothetical protein [candidate division Zixibacteria bacterium]